MNITAVNQPIVFLLCVICGIVIAVIFDLFRIHRTLFKVSKLSIFLADSLFWILASFVALQFIIYSNNGVLRVFEFLGIAVGIIFHIVFLSKVFRGVVVFLLKLLNKIARFVLKIVIFPIAFILRMLRRPYFAVLYGFKSGGKRFARFARRI